MWVGRKGRWSPDGRRLRVTRIKTQATISCCWYRTLARASSPAACGLRAFHPTARPLRTKLPSLGTAAQACSCRRATCSIWPVATPPISARSRIPCGMPMVSICTPPACEPPTMRAGHRPCNGPRCVSAGIANPAPQPSMDPARLRFRLRSARLSPGPKNNEARSRPVRARYA